MKLNIGCGRDYRPGWINIDISREVKADMYLDIRKDEIGSAYTTKKDLPGGGQDIRTEAWLGYGKATLIWISGVLEQIGPNEEFVHAMRECYRMLAPGGIMQVVVPNAKYAIAHRDPMDVRKFTPETFQYFKAGTNEYTLYGSVYGFDGWSEISIDENARHIMTITMKK